LNLQIGSSLDVLITTMLASQGDAGKPSFESVRLELKDQGVTLDGDLTIPPGSLGLVLFAHGSGSSRHSPRNRYVASELHKVGVSTLLMDLLTPEEERVDERTRHIRFDIDLLSKRLLGATDAIKACKESVKNMKIGYFGASTGGAAALQAGAQRSDVSAAVSRGGRPDLTGKSFLERINIPTLLLVGGRDYGVIELNEEAFNAMKNCQTKELTIVPGATHLFEEPGKLEQVAQHAAQWFKTYLGPQKQTELQPSKETEKLRSEQGREQTTHLA